MRVHRLEVTAFGPFAGTQVVDFEPLNAAGVFLLTGPTGAGKTSVLDAICFGLYGQVPGVRDRAKAYRSHHAGRDVVPRVVLEVTLQGRRFRISRQPAWSRPSSRARSGFVEEKARATAEELIEGTWVARSSRADEVGHLVSRLLGLNRDQFCQVVMLPQGDFQAFLRAGGRDRQHILETLFGTQRFQEVERWLVEYRRAQARLCREQEDRLGRLAERLHEACALTGAQEQPPPSAWVSFVDQLSVDDRRRDDPGLLQAARALVESEAATVLTTRTAASMAAERAKNAQHQLSEALALAERQSRYLEAERRRTALLASRDMVTARSERVRRGRVAAALMPLVTVAQRDTDTYAAAVSAAEAVVASSVGAGHFDPTRPLTAADIRDRVEQRDRQVSLLTELAPVEKDCERLSGDIAAQTAARTALGQLTAELAEGVASDPGSVAGLRTGLEAAGVVAAQVPLAKQREAAARQIWAAAQQVVSIDNLIRERQVERAQARERVSDARERWLSAREHRLTDIAADLAGQLVDGHGCPVCGSVAHPAPAKPSVTHVSSEEEASLLADVDALQGRLARLEAETRDVLVTRSGAWARAQGQAVSAAAAAVETAVQQHELALAAVADQVRLTAELRTRLVEVEGRRARLATATAQLAVLGERIAGGETSLAKQRARLDGRADSAVSVLAQLVDARLDLDLARRLEAVIAAREEADRTVSRTLRQRDDAIVLTEFADAGQVVAASLAPAEIANDDALNRAYDNDLAEYTRAMADPVLAAAAVHAVPDLCGLDAAAALATDDAVAATSLADAVERRQSRLEELTTQLAGHFDELLPLRVARDLADDVAGLCSGTSADNTTKTALSHYVLAARLSQVVAAANVRLDVICGGRYQLRHTIQRGAGDARGGLGLVVSDTHTDRERDPATLSGGETFYVSLSLALGLADVVTAEAGGSELATLFVDEGFGSLDDDTRDEVLDELDALRSGGRSIGIVSHLSELRARFPVRLHVVAESHGSRLLAPTPD